MHDQQAQAYSIFSIKSLNEDQRTFSGTATTPTPDSTLDVVEPLGVSFTNPSPLLLFHDVERPVGFVNFHPPTAKGVDFTASIPKIDEPGTLKNRVDEAWQSVKARLITGVSVRIRAKPDDVKAIKGGGLHWLKANIRELSLVTLGSNPDATIATIKSLDVVLAAPGLVDEIDAHHSAGASAPSRAVKARSQDRSIMKKTTAEQIKDFEATRAAKAARMAEIMDLSAEKGESLDEAQETEYDELKTDVETVDKHLVRLNAHEALMKTAAKAVDGTTAEIGSAARAGHQIIRVTDNLFPGQRFARLAMCVGMSKGSRSDAISLCQQHYPDDARMLEVIKVAVGAGTTASGGGPLVQYTDFTGDFVDFLRPQTIIGKMNLRRVPFNSRVSTQTAGGTGYWVGEGKPKPLTKGTFSTITLTFNKVAAISVLTKEEMRFATPSAEQKVRDDLAAGLIQKLDADFVDPSKAVSAGVSPASITNGLTPHTASGTNAAAVRADFAAMMGDFITAEIEPTTGVFLMSPTRALQISLMMNALSAPEFPNITMMGGTLLGFPVIVSSALATGSSPSTDMIIFANQSDIYLADDGGVNVEASDQASLEMLDSSLVQDATNGTGTSLVSLWQTNCVGLRAEREITWKLRRAAGVSYISNAAYTA